ncbi:hypothetical protein [Gimesia panareensis]|nr:hypothetical protein [Gimesia panareensis]
MQLGPSTASRKRTEKQIDPASGNQPSHTAGVKLPAAQTLAGTTFLQWDLPLTDYIQTHHFMKKQRNAVDENR